MHPQWRLIICAHAPNDHAGGAVWVCRGDRFTNLSCRRIDVQDTCSDMSRGKSGHNQIMPMLSGPYVTLPPYKKHWTFYTANGVFLFFWLVTKCNSAILLLATISKMLQNASIRALLGVRIRYLVDLVGIYMRFHVIFMNPHNELWIFIVNLLDL